MDIHIIKKDGSKTEYQESKIVRVVTAAGLKPDQAQHLGAVVTKWIQALPDPDVVSLQVRNKVVDELKKINENAADLFTWYEKTKDQQMDQAIAG